MESRWKEDEYKGPVKCQGWVPVVRRAVTFLGGILKRTSWGTQARPSCWSESALLWKLQDSWDAEERDGAFWCSSPRALFLRGIQGQKSTDSGNAGTFIQGRQGWGYTTWPIRLGIEKWTKQGKDLTKMAQLTWGDEKGGKEPMGYNQLTCYW